ncbi:MAG: tripartite tricarboxylate transporter substrate binding protein [Gammaproteobacteria bacterium]|nr:tripartite tricarboxylate transporter substrate binding protein [Gammaproteobacteria bacterium]NIM71788.1 tripartite tricarboxylate transporter substrate binding protein [Gammaproteobacteria bacterium]NIN37910.1 tripartite tricarboxylate transporter substrate binding protein [Gammaproteobacteria bacterium]NIO23544.1 tripartite tricarboxylate transporter substrate binding protein [Gammaproteobacteria bacterium]NIO64160.1 tripartite tricarboxylate transporter substrate binding protein [Gammapr
MTVRKLIISAVSLMALAGFLLPMHAHAVNIPCKTAKLIVPWKAGGGTHVIFSIFEKTIQELDVTPKVKVVTIPGQGGNKGAKEAQRAKPDGCTLFAIHQSAITSYLNGRIDFAFEAFDTVALLTSTPDIVGASGKVPWNSFDDLKKAAMAAPDTIKTGATFGSTSQFMWLILEDLTGMKFSYVPYDGTRERMTAILSGAIQLGTINVASGRKYIESGELKAFAIAADKRSKHLPDLPTLKELGVPLVYALKRGIVAPKGTPPDVIEHWSQIFKKAAENPALMKQMDAKGTDVEWVGPADYKAWAKETYDAHEKVAIKIGMYKK